MRSRHDKYMTCPRCKGTGRTIGTPVTGMPVALARICNPPCSGCKGRGVIELAFYQDMLNAQRLVREVKGVR